MHVHYFCFSVSNLCSLGLIQNLHLAGVSIFSEELAPAEWCEHIGNRHILLMLSGGKTGLASAPQKAHGIQMKEIRTLSVSISLHWLWAHLHGLECVYVKMCVHIELLFQSAC